MTQPCVFPPCCNWRDSRVVLAGWLGFETYNESRAVIGWIGLKLLPATRAGPSLRIFQLPSLGLTVVQGMGRKSTDRSIEEKDEVRAMDTRN